MLAGLVTSKIEDGNVKAALRLLSSGDTPAMNDKATISALLAKHRIIPVDRRPAAARQDYTAIQIIQAYVVAVNKTFFAGSSGGPDGVRPQHIMNMESNKENGHALIALIKSFINMLLEVTVTMM